MNTETEQLIETLYVRDHLSGEAISQRVGVDRHRIHRFLKSRGLTRNRSERIRSNHFNQDFFEAIDSHEKAQILGLWYADGNVRIQASNTLYRSYSCRVQLAEEDKDYLEQINRRLGCTTDLKFIKRARPQYQDGRALILYCEKTYNDLIDKGCIPRKSLVLVFPTVTQVPELFWPSFMLGYFEGDGCINNYIGKIHPYSMKSAFTICGTWEFCQEYGRILQDKCGVHFGMYRPKSCVTNNYSLRISGNRQVWRVAQFLYQNATLRMERKWLGFQEIKDDLDRIDAKPYANHRIAINPSVLLESPT